MFMKVRGSDMKELQVLEVAFAPYTDHVMQLHLEPSPKRKRAV